MASALSESKKLTSDPGVHYLAALIDTLTARLDACCPPTSIKAPDTDSKSAASPASSGAASKKSK